MAHKTWTDVKAYLDNASGSLTEITASTNQVSLTGVQAILDDSVFGNRNSVYLPGIAGATYTLNGFVNSTIEAMLGPLIGNQTSVTKTAQFYDGLKYRYGEVYPTNIVFSGSVNTIQAWSGDFTFSGAVTRSSTTTT